MPRPSPATARFHAEIVQLEKLVSRRRALFAKMPLHQVLAVLTYPTRHDRYRLRQTLLWTRLGTALGDELYRLHEHAANRLFKLQRSKKDSVAFKAVMTVLRLALPPDVSTSPKRARPKRPNSRRRNHLRSSAQRFQKPLKPATIKHRHCGATPATARQARDIPRPVSPAPRPTSTIPPAPSPSRQSPQRIANPPPAPYDLSAAPTRQPYALANQPQPHAATGCSPASHGCLPESPMESPQ